MSLADQYRLLEVDPSASDEEVKRAWRELAQVWHPDRFAHDPALRLRAEEKLKSIHGAYEAVKAARGAGAVESEPGAGEAPAGNRAGRERNRALLAAAAGLFLLLRRPTPVGLVVALGLFALSIYFVTRMRAAAREGPGSASRGRAGP